DASPISGEDRGRRSRPRSRPAVSPVEAPGGIFRASSLAPGLPCGGLGGQPIAAHRQREPLVVARKAGHDRTASVGYKPPGRQGGRAGQITRKSGMRGEQPTHENEPQGGPPLDAVAPRIAALTEKIVEFSSRYAHAVVAVCLVLTV